jgi:hypothetical protein
MWMPLAPVTPHDVAPDHGPVTAVGHVDAVLGLRARHDVVLDQEIVAEPRENAPASVEVTGVAADRDVVIQHGADARPRQARHREALDHDVARALEVDPVGRRRVLRVDDRAGLAAEGDGIGRRAARRQIETRIASGSHDHQIAGPHGVGGLLKRAPWARDRAAAASLPAGST